MDFSIIMDEINVVFKFYSYWKNIFIGAYTFIKLNFGIYLVYINALILFCKLTTSYKKYIVMAIDRTKLNAMLWKSN